jgi:hypothetical protein
MKLPSCLTLSRHHVFRLRSRVPDDLRRYFHSKELRRSLRIRDKRGAVHAASLLALRTDLLFEALRSMSNGKKKPDELVRQDLIVEMDLSELARPRDTHGDVCVVTWSDGRKTRSI